MVLHHRGVFFPSDFSNYMKNVFLSLFLTGAFLAIVGCGGATAGLDAVKSVTGSFGDITSALSGITDKASAEGAVSQLEGAGNALSGVAGKLDSLPAPIKEKITGSVGDFQGKFDGLVEKVSAIPGVGGVIQGPIDNIKTQLTALAGG